MAQLNQILTRKFKAEDLKILSEKIAQESGESWITKSNLDSYNKSLSNKDPGTFKKIIIFLFMTHPNIGFLTAMLIPPVLLLPIALTSTPLILFFGLFIGFVVGSFIFPALVKNCMICGSFKSSERIFTYCLDFDEHTEERISKNGVRTKHRVRNETVFCVYECNKCKARKIEVLKQTKEKQL